MAYILDGMTLAMEGQLSPAPPAGDYCLTPFALVSQGIIVLEVAAAEVKLADPRSREPWDLDYLRHKYRKELAQLRAHVEAPAPRPAAAQPAVEQRDQALSRLEGIEADIRLLQARGQADLSRLERELDQAVLAAAMLARRRLQNLIAAIDAVIRMYF